MVNHHTVHIKGSIYTPTEDLETIKMYVLRQYKTHGIEFAQHIDGEYSIAILDHDKNQVIVACDMFKTAPMYVKLSANDINPVNLSRMLELSLETNQKIIAPIANTTCIYDSTTGELLDQQTNRVFNYAEYKTSFFDWREAFKAAVLKRGDGPGVAISLSSGYDSGAIMLELVNAGIIASAYTILQDPNAYQIIKERIIHTGMRVKFVNNSERKRNEAIELLQTQVDIHGYLREIADYIDTGLLESHGGEINLAIIALSMAENGNRIHLSGMGADGIMVEGYNSYPSWGVGPIRGQSYVDNACGITTRYPFLDPDVVQEYLSLAPELKKQAYKAPIDAMFREYGFPYEPGVKYGFGIPGFTANIKELYACNK